MARWLQAAGCAILVLLIGFVWLLYVYLDSKEELARLQKQQTQPAPAQVVQAAPVPDVRETAEAFCRALYQQNPSSAELARYTTEKGKAAVVPPGDGAAKSKLERSITIQNVQLYEGKKSAKAATIVAAVKRTTTISKVATTSTAYVQLELLYGKEWRVNKVTVIGEMPAD